MVLCTRAAAAVLVDQDGVKACARPRCMVPPGLDGDRPPTSVLARCVLQINSQMNDDATGKGGKGGKGKGGGKGGGKGKGKGAGQDRLRGYVNNLLLKINEKMGGVNWTPHGRGLGLLRDMQTLVVGLDVQCAAPATQSRCPSHAAPGTLTQFQLPAAPVSAVQLPAHSHASLCVRTAQPPAPRGGRAVAPRPHVLLPLP